MQALRPLGASLPDHLVNLVRYGRVIDIERMHTVLGFSPPLDTRHTVLATYGRIPEENG